MKNLKIIRKTKGMTMKELGEMIGVKGLTIYRYEKGSRKPSIDIAMKIAAILQVPVEELFTEVDKDIETQSKNS